MHALAQTCPRGLRGDRQAQAPRSIRSAKPRAQGPRELESGPLLQIAIYIFIFFCSQLNLSIPRGENTSLAPPTPGEVRVRNIIGSFLGGFEMGRALPDLPQTKFLLFGPRGYHIQAGRPSNPARASAEAPESLLASPRGLEPWPSHPLRVAGCSAS